ncbi:purine permease 3-like isoform X1 [Macadamia integrifolia]|uniref:purine permease 3-like isoform X1 n=1 Tax=Macadamia integrifolia TaxID=60698 RepID=UPI001C4F7E58|nr:purine permease 3-like isoform X1 [Macadamia integrifolia]
MEMQPGMEVSHQQFLKKEDVKINKALKRVLLLINCAMLGIGNCGGPLLLRLYFVRGGKRIWFSSWLETGGWPVILFPFAASYLRRRLSKGGGDSPDTTRLFFMKPFIFVACAVIGILTGLDDYIYAAGVARLPVSTASLIIASHLAFTAFFAFLLVGQRFTPYSINAIALLTVAGVVLGLHTSGDRPANESNKQYLMGFFMTIAAAALYGLVLPMVELTYKKARQTITFSLVMEMQMVISIFATLFCTIGMLVNKDFEVIPREAREYELGEAKYYLVVAFSAIIWQFFFLGAIGVIFYGSSLLAAVIITTVLPITEILAVFIFQEAFKPEKAISLFLSLWGFASYFYGEFKGSKKRNKIPEPENPRLNPPLSSSPVTTPK